MVEIHVHHGRDGERTYITQGRKTVVIDGVFEDNRGESVRTGKYSTNYLYGT